MPNKNDLGTRMVLCLKLTALFLSFNLFEVFLVYLIIIPDNKNMFNFVKTREKVIHAEQMFLQKFIITRSLFMQNKCLYRIYRRSEEHLILQNASQWLFGKLDTNHQTQICFHCYSGFLHLFLYFLFIFKNVCVYFRRTFFQKTRINAKTTRIIVQIVNNG